MENFFGSNFNKKLRKIKNNPLFLTEWFADCVAKGKQKEAHDLLGSINEKQLLLTTLTEMTDYSGRKFHCTAYEYAYWALDKHMCIMLKRHMDNATTMLFSKKERDIEQFGLTYQQHGLTYKNPHYDMSFVLKNLTSSEFIELQKMLKSTVDKIQNASIENYQYLAFSADEYETLKKAIALHQQSVLTSFFYTSTADAILKKLQFDFNSLITALDNYVTKFNPFLFFQHKARWLNVGKAERDVPAHIANKYCRSDTALSDTTTLSRDLTFYNVNLNKTAQWFPLTSSTSGLGFDFALTRAQNADQCEVGRYITQDLENYNWPLESTARKDLMDLRHFYEQRRNDLNPSDEELNQLSYT